MIDKSLPRLLLRFLDAIMIEALGEVMRILPRSILSSKYGYFWLPKNQEGNGHRVMSWWIITYTWILIRRSGVVLIISCFCQLHKHLALQGFVSKIKNGGIMFFYGKLATYIHDKYWQNIKCRSFCLKHQRQGWTQKGQNSINQCCSSCKAPFIVVY